MNFLSGLNIQCWNALYLVEHHKYTGMVLLFKVLMNLLLEIPYQMDKRQGGIFSFSKASDTLFMKRTSGRITTNVFDGSYGCNIYMKFYRISHFSRIRTSEVCYGSFNRI